jgi:uncharacterized protein YuzE
MKDPFKIMKDYDAESDTLYLRIINEYKYRESVELKDNIILDFDENYVPVALEILDASKFFNIKPYSLRMPMGIDMNIVVGEDKISLNASFTFILHQKREERPVTVNTVNDIELPSTQTNYALAEA